MEPDSYSIDSPALRDLVARAADVAQAVIRPNAEREDRDAVWPAASLRALGEAGLLGLLAPAELGGHGQGMSGLVAVAAQLARESPSTALCFAMHCVGTAVIAAKATAAQRERYLVPIAAGRHITTLALSEPGTGAHFWIPQVTLSRTDGGFRVNGTKSFITNGGHADSYVVSTVAAPGTARADAQAGDPAAGGEFSVVVVDAAADGLAWQDAWRGFGMRANSSRTAELHDVFVPTDSMLGEQGDQQWYVFEVIAPFFLMAMAGTYIGVAAECVAAAREHLATRRHAHTGELLGASPVLAHRLGEMWIRLESARQLVHSAARLGDSGDADALIHILGCKAAAVVAAVDLANEAMTLAGGIAYRDNSKLARMLRDARAGHVMAPTTDMLLTWVGHAQLKLPLL
jgi:isovaleryl-CoA dehydrogenase